MCNCVYVSVSAADWKLDEPDWTGRLKVVSKGSHVVLKLEDSNTGQYTTPASVLLVSTSHVLLMPSISRNKFILKCVFAIG